MSFKDIAECLDIQTDTDYVSAGVLTTEGINYVFEEVSRYCARYKKDKKVDAPEEVRLAKENKLIQNLLSEYISPDAVVRKVNWIEKFQFINDYTTKGSRLSFLEQQPKGPALIWFEDPDGFMLTIFPSIMTFINDMYYYENSVLPEFNFDEVSSYDVFNALEQAILSKICGIEKEVEEFVS